MLKETESEHFKKKKPAHSQDPSQHGKWDPLSENDSKLLKTGKNTKRKKFISIGGQDTSSNVRLQILSPKTLISGYNL